MNFICIDLEGPLSPQDNAYELMKLFPDGERVFEVISRYDDLLALEGREDYEPGDTLALIVPFLIYHGISEGDILRLSERAGLVEGARELIGGLNARGWKVFCISTSYEQYAHRIAHRVGIAPENVSSTRFPLDKFRRELEKEDLFQVAQIERNILRMRPFVDDTVIKETLNRFFWSDLPPTKLGEVMKRVKPVGGNRKVEALKGFAEDRGMPLSKVVVVGDSITDARMLETVNNARGLAIAFNANEYALPHSTLGLASTHLSDLAPVLEAWERGGRREVERLVKERETSGGIGNRGHFHWLAGRADFSEPLRIHKLIRRIVREEAAKLG